MSKPNYYKTSSEVYMLLSYVLIGWVAYQEFGLWGALWWALLIYPATFFLYMMVIFPIDEWLNKKDPRRINY